MDFASRTLLVRAASTATHSSTPSPTGHAAPQKKSTFRRIILPIIIVLIVIIVLAIVVFLIMRYRKRNKANHDGEEAKQDPNQYNETNGAQEENKEEEEVHDNGNHNIQPPAQSWQPVNGLHFSGKQSEQEQEGAGNGSDNKAKAIELAKKGWAMYKDHKNKPQ